MLDIDSLSLPCWCASLTITKTSLAKRESAFVRWKQVAERHPCVLLATCERLEWYGSSPVELSRLAEKESLTCYHGAACMEHLMRVAAGWESTFVGESDVQGQVKRAYAEAVRLHQLPSALHYLFQKSLRAAKLLRQQTPQVHTGLAQVASQMLLDHTSDGETLVFIGASAMNRGILHALQGVKRNKVLLSRYPKKAQRFPPWVEIVDWPHAEWLEQAHAICCATRSEEIWVEGVSPVTRLILDLSVPRRINPDLGRQVTLCNVDQVLAMVGDRSNVLHGNQTMLRELMLRYLGMWQSKRIMAYA